MKFNEKFSGNIHSICIMVKQWKACRWTSSGRWERKHKQKGMYHVTPGATLQKHSHSPWASDERRQRRERGRRRETGRVRGRKGREGGISNKMLIAWSVINAQILPERRRFQSNFRSQKVQSSCRGVRGRIWALICYLIMKGQFISCVYLSKWEAGSNPDNIPLVSVNKGKPGTFSGVSLEQPCSTQQDEPLQGWGHRPSSSRSFPPAQGAAPNPVHTNTFIQSKQEYFLLPTRLKVFKLYILQINHEAGWQPWEEL